jgi:hypothetical protein
MQSSLHTFYTPPDPIPNGLGTVIRSEPLDIGVAGGSAQRILYVSERPDGTRAACGGMIFIPDSPAPSDGRVQWGRHEDFWAFSDPGFGFRGRIGKGGHQVRHVSPNSL